MTDRLHKFLFEGLPVRGMLVQLRTGWRELLSRRATVSDGGHAFGPEVRGLLGEMSAAACLMHANIKFDGALILQVFGDGPVKLAVAEARTDLGFRATAKVVGDVPTGAQLAAMLNVHGQGRCAITLDPERPLDRASSPIRASCRCTATSASRCSSCRRCSSTTCCNPSNSTRAWCSPPTTTAPPAC